MKKRFTKALALLLSAMLIIGLAPTAFATEGESTTEMSEVKVVYKFNKAGLASGNTKTQLINNTGGAINYADTNGFWRYGTRNSSVGNAAAYKDIVEKYLSISANGDADGYIVLVLNVPVKGGYKVTLEHWKRNDGVSQGGVHIIPASDDIQVAVKNAIENNAGLCSDAVSYYDANGTSAATAVRGETDLGTHFFEAGEHYVIFTQKSNETGKAMRFSALTLDGGSNTVPMISNLTATPDANGGATVKAEATLMSDGTAATDVTYSYSVAEEDAKVASVDAETGIVTGKLNGTATIIATATTGNYSSSKSIEVSVTNPDMSGIKVVYDMQVSKIEHGVRFDAVSYSDTNGFWMLEERYNDPVLERNTKYGIIVYPNVGAWWAIRMNIPKAGLYSLKLDRGLRPQGGLAFFYFGKASESAGVIAENDRVAEEKFYAVADMDSVETDVLGGVDIKTAGEYILVIRTPAAADFTSAGLSLSNRRHFIKQIILDGGPSTVPMINVTADNDAITVGGTAKVTATSALMSDATTAVTNPEITYATEDTDIVSVNSSTGEVTGLSDGVATVTATVTANGKSSSRSVDITVNNKEISEGFNAKMEVAENYIAPSVTGLTEGGVITAQPNADGSYNLTAPDAKDGSEFLYWAMGMGTNKRIVSFDAILEKYVPEGNNVNYLVPVYASDVAADVEEYYNINGQRIAAVQVGAEKPALPSIPGIGAAKEWKQCAENVYVAEYESTVYNKVTVNGEKVDYGTKIECKPDAKEGTFRFWKKTVNGKEEVVSLEPEYTFYAWENTTVTAEYGDDAPMFTGEKLKIIIDSFDVNGETGIMAEFIGLSNAVEKGIMFTDAASSETRKMAMTTKDNQFTVIANMSGTYTGYAIVGDKANGYTLITDGEYIK